MNPFLSSVAVAMLLAVSGCEKSRTERSTVATRGEPSANVGAPALEPRPTEPTPSAVSPSSPLAAQAVPLISKFAAALQGALGSAMSQGGPVAAIDVCSSEAPRISRDVSSDEFTIRRIGTRVRNPDNRPTDAELEVLKRLTAEQPTYEAEGRFYKAIFVQPLCLACHGAKDALGTGVLAALRRKYPSDEAVGYAVGDLRGAFVVERKASSR